MALLLICASIALASILVGILYGLTWPIISFIASFSVGIVFLICTKDTKTDELIYNKYHTLELVIMHSDADITSNTPEVSKFLDNYYSEIEREVIKINTKIMRNRKHCNGIYSMLHSKFVASLPLLEFNKLPKDTLNVIVEPQLK